MKRVLHLFAQDFKLLLRNAIFWVLTITLFVIILLIHFAVPKEASPPSFELYVHGIDPLPPGAFAAASPAEAERLVAETGGVGIVWDGAQYTVLSGGLDDKAAAALVAQLQSGAPGTDVPEVTLLSEGREAPAQNIGLLPVFLCFEAVVLGFLMAAILLLAEKQDNVLRAYRISPGGAAAYTAAKVLLFTAVGTLYALVMTVGTVGFDFNIPAFLLLTVLGCAFYTLLGLSVAVFFRDLSGWFFTALVILGINMLPAAGYAMPSFAPGWMRAIVSHPMLFAYRDILFAQGGDITATLVLFAVLTAAAGALCVLLIRKKLLTAH